MRFEYLLFNIVVISGPVLALLFYPRIQKIKASPLFISILISALLFVIVDEVVTNMFWSFNQMYIIGFTIGKVPIEEILFFITVPFACLLLWVNWMKQSKGSKLHIHVPLILGSLSGVVSIVSLLLGLYYTASVLFAFTCCIGLDAQLKTDLFRRFEFLSFLCFVNVLTAVFNLYLTSRPVVMYNSLWKSNLNLLTIPLEDFVYGIALISLVVIIYEYANSKLRI